MVFLSSSFDNLRSNDNLQNEKIYNIMVSSYVSSDWILEEKS
jgi:hypothetical protein